VWVLCDYSMTDWARETGTVKYMVSQRATHCTLSCSVYVSRLSERLSVSIRLHTLWTLGDVQRTCQWMSDPLRSAR
jgi:hypothetical protein